MASGANFHTISATDKTISTNEIIFDHKKSGCPAISLLNEIRCLDLKRGMWRKFKMRNTQSQWWNCSPLDSDNLRNPRNFFQQSSLHTRFKGHV